MVACEKRLDETEDGGRREKATYCCQDHTSKTELSRSNTGDLSEEVEPMRKRGSASSKEVEGEKKPYHPTVHAVRAFHFFGTR